MSTDIRSIRAGEIMTRMLISATSGQPLAEADALLIEHRIGGVPVVDDGRLVGVLSRSDIARIQVLMSSLDGQVSDQLSWPDQADGFQHVKPGEFHGFQRMIGDLKVKDAMHDQPVTCACDTPVNEVAEAMIRLHIHRVIVVEDDRPVGIISSLDLVKLLAGH